MRYTLGSYFSIGLIQPGTIVRAVKLDVAFAAKTRGWTRAREREGKQIEIGKEEGGGERGKITFHSRERERVRRLVRKSGGQLRRRFYWRRRGRHKARRGSREGVNGGGVTSSPGVGVIK